MQPQQAPTPNYDFIVNPQGSARKSPFSFGGNSVITRLILVLGGIVVLLILFVVVKGLLSSSGSNVPSLLRVAQAQQELVHISSNALQQQNVTLSDATKNLASTVQLGVGSEQTQLLTYMKTNHANVTAKQLALGVSATVDNQLTAAVTAGTFDKTYQQVMQTQLAEYLQVLKQAYSSTKGPKGRALLNDDFTAAQLLQQQ